MHYPFFKIGLPLRAAQKRMVFYSPGGGVKQKNALRSPFLRRAFRGLTGIGITLAACVGGAVACARSEETRIAERILERYRTASSAKPLAAAQQVRLRLTSPGGAHGTAEILWQDSSFRERQESAGIASVKGLQGGKAFYTDEDGVTRVASEPVVRELVTRFYFWRKAFLFRDREKEAFGLGPADDATASVRFRLHLGNTLDLVFSRRDGQLVAVHSPRFQLEFSSPSRFRDVSDRGEPVETEILWTGLPTGPLIDVAAGGGQARFPGRSIELPYEFSGGGPVLAGTIAGAPARIRVNGSAGGLVRVCARLAERTGLRFVPDAFGREVAGPAELALGGLVFPSVHLEKADDLQDADAEAGGPIFRETVLECDPAARRLRFHDPAIWAPPEGYRRFIIDDDGNLPVAPLRRGAREFRVVLGTAGPERGIVLAPEAASRLGFSRGETAATDLGWANHTFPAVPVTIGKAPRAPDWGDDGTLAWEPLLGYRTFIDMPRRWIYLGPATESPGSAVSSTPPQPPQPAPRPGAGGPATPRS
jgi:hypothetical protein